MQRMVLNPSLYLAGRNRGLTRADYSEFVESNTLGVLPDSTVKFLLLRDVIPKRTADELFRTLNALPFNSAQQSRRAAVRGSVGGELAFGWMDYKPGGPRFLAPANICAIAYYFHLLPLLNAMSSLMAEHLPKQWQAQAHAAQQNGRMTIGTEWLNPYNVAIFRPKMFGQTLRLLAAPIFSTITINRNIECRLHRDGGNQTGA
jgi:hypothetical protein